MIGNVITFVLPRLSCPRYNGLIVIMVLLTLVIVAAIMLF